MDSPHPILFVFRLTPTMFPPLRKTENELAKPITRKQQLKPRNCQTSHAIHHNHRRGSHALPSSFCVSIFFSFPSIQGTEIMAPNPTLPKFFFPLNYRVAHHHLHAQSSVLSCFHLIHGLSPSPLLFFLAPNDGLDVSPFDVSYPKAT